MALFSIMLASLFNIGFFTIIGIHFIGFIDISNVVYSFGLVFLISTPLFFFLFYFIDALEFSQNSEAVKRSNWFCKRIFLPAASIIAATIIGGVIFFNWKFYSYVFAMLTVTGSVFLSVQLLWEYKSKGSLSVSSIGLIAIIAAFFAVILGSASAERQMRVGEKYYISTNATQHIEARIIRTSSYGVILYAAERVMFIPMSELKLIRSSQDVR
ncbi:MAG: hypothetical protein KF904_17795 [Rhodoblastus sp.]|nr:hypothetical protein [Rhodoblastus sp.]